MAQLVAVLTTCSPQFVSVRRIGTWKPSNSLTKCPTIPSPSFSASLRYALFCCRACSSSSVECNLPSSAKIFIKGLPLSTSKGRLMKVFSEFGEVNLVQLPIDRESGQSLGFAYIWFAKEECAQLAVKEMNGKFFDGRFIYVTIAKPGSSKRSKGTTPYKF
ncbi:glycine-rich RNA-binding protein 4, mitochondrial [Abrus precatorius]|uniref:Glycine-rich RNA-binding protein 4, mitochondrial n=1 Tax=Abrus precatorius TaxID=3816 RepID=A0A8B8JS61_ABRPR|nr:glycine-rich RNA-binding protein 4, mitochondrial [Abrus precatorius]